jgi:hypothetical protein
LWRVMWFSWWTWNVSPKRIWEICSLSYLRHLARYPARQLEWSWVGRSVMFDMREGNKSVSWGPTMVTLYPFEYDIRRVQGLEGWSSGGRGLA